MIFDLIMEQWTSFTLNHLQDGGYMGVFPTSLHVFCGLVEASDHVPQLILWGALWEYGVPDFVLGPCTTSVRA